MASKAFRRRLNRLKKLAIQETLDGCVKCSRLSRRGRVAGKICSECSEKICSIITEPRKHFGTQLERFSE